MIRSPNAINVPKLLYYLTDFINVFVGITQTLNPFIYFLTYSINILEYRRGTRSEF